MSDDLLKIAMAFVEQPDESERVRAAFAAIPRTCHSCNENQATPGLHTCFNCRWPRHGPSAWSR
jgi:hypothetical protein